MNCRERIAKLEMLLRMANRQNDRLRSRLEQSQSETACLETELANVYAEVDRLCAELHCARSMGAWRRN